MMSESSDTSRDEAQFDAVLEILKEFDIEEAKAEAAAGRIVDLIERMEKELRHDLSSFKSSLSDREIEELYYPPKRRI